MNRENPPALEGYLARLSTELRKRGVPESRFLEESRGHLSDAIDSGIRRGLTPESASDEALARFGDPKMVAARFAAEESRIRDRILLTLAIALGLAIAWVDARPHWDDSGITAGMLLLSAGALGMIGPRRCWLWALGVGLWVPLHLIVQAPSIGNLLGGFVILAFPMAGAYAGMGLRRLIAHEPEAELPPDR